MIDFNSWWNGATGRDDPSASSGQAQDDPVSRALRAMQGAASGVGQGIASAAQTVGDDLSSAASSVGQGLGSLVAPPTAPAPWDEPLPPQPPEQTWTGTAALLGQAAEAGRQAAAEAVAPGVTRPPAGPEEVIAASMPAPARAVQAASAAGQAAGAVLGRHAAEQLGGGDEPTLGVGPVRFSPQDVGAFVGGAALDPTAYVGGGEAGALERAGARAAADAVPGLVAGLGRSAAGLSPAVDTAAPVERALLELGGGFVPSGRGPNLEARIADARAALDAAAERLRPLDAALGDAADAGTDAELRAAHRAYAPARAAYDDAASTLAALEDARRATSARIEGAGFGRPLEAADTLPSELAQRGGETGGVVPPYPYETSAAPSANAGFRPELAPGVRAGLVNAAQGALVGEMGADTQEQATGAPYDPTRHLAYAAGGAGLGVVAGRAAARDVLGRAAVRDAAAEASRLAAARDAAGLAIRAPAELGSGFVPEVPASGAAAGEEGGAAAGEALRGLGPLLDRLPKVRDAADAAAARADRMRERGLTPPSAYDWVKQVMYNSAYGAGTPVGQLLGGAADLLYIQPREMLDAALHGGLGQYADQLKAMAAAAPEGARGAGAILAGRGPEAAERLGGASPGRAGLSERTAGTGAHAAARALEYTGEVLAQSPDALFRPINREQGMLKEAQAVARAGGYRGQKARDYVETLMGDARYLLENPTTRSTSDNARRVVAAGEAHADDMAYRGKAGPVASWLGEQARRDDLVGVAATLMAPFARISTKVLARGGRLIPGVGLLPGIRAERPFHAAYDQAMGGAAALALWQLANRGALTGSGPADPERRDEMVSQGWQPHSIYVGGHYLPTRWAGRMQGLLDAVGELHDAVSYGKRDAGWQDLASDAVKRGTQIVTDQAGLSGLLDLHDVLDGGLKRLPAYAAQQATRFVPYAGILRSVANATDPAARRSERDNPLAAFGQELATPFPGLRQLAVPERQDVLGRTLPNPARGLAVARPDPAIGLFEGSGYDIPAPPTTLTVGKVSGVPLGASEQRRWQAIRGEMLKQAGDELAADPELVALDPAIRRQQLQKIVGSLKTAADKQLLAEIGEADPESLDRRIEEAARKAAVEKYGAAAAS